MSYLVFARKYRPQTFDDVVGQPHITATLTNAIEQSRVAHAYLFSGPRGVGKTTTARILAKALNCDKAPSPKPCNTCSSCREITEGTSLDILEIDGASNRGIEEIRSLRENAKFSPSRGRFRIYIIDEVHMLSADAFNALLKTLEEPPAHLKFIFATTHPHKVPVTILSRCQRFDFRRISAKDITANLAAISSEEKLDIKNEALGLIARHSDGSLRDAQVILDQIVSFTSGRAGPEDVAKILGIAGDELLFGLSASIKNKDTAGALRMIDALIDDGKDVVQVILDMIGHFRNIAVAKIGPSLNSLIDAGPDRIKRYETEAGDFTIEDILYIIYTLSNTIDFARKSGLSRVPFEAAMVKLTRACGIMPLAEIVKRIESLEMKASSGDAPKALDAAAPTAFRSAKPNGDEAPSRKECQAPVSGLDDILSSWTKVISYIKARKISVASYLEEGSPVALEAGMLTIGFPKEHQFHKEVLEAVENKRLIEEGISKALGADLKVALTTIEPSKAGNGKVRSSDETLPYADPDGGAVRSDETDPIVKAAIEMFGGKVSGEKSKGGGR